MRIIKKDIWLDVTKKAKQIYNNKLFDLFVLYDNKNIKIAYFSQLVSALEVGLSVYIKVGTLPHEVIAKTGRKVYQTTFDSEIHSSMEKAITSICTNYNLDKDSFKAEKQYISISGNIVTIFPFNQKVITRILK